ncbi:MAG: hypothetical protein JXA33_10345 [Anaerolineae bacterium]|nr:hypothetical protein [Anaerolineae bacterium]
MLKGHQDMLWLAGQVFLWPDFVEEAENLGLDKVFELCPYKDLAEDEKATFTEAFNNPKLREVVALWWKVYQEARESGAVPKALWEP